MKIKDAKDIKPLLETRLSDAYATLGLGKATKKIRKAIARAAKKVSSEIKDYLRKENRKKAKKVTKVSLKKPKKPTAPKNSTKKK